MRRLNDEQMDRLEKQADELQRLNAKLSEASLANKQLNDELNEKTEQICHLHSENSRYLKLFYFSSFSQTYLIFCLKVDN